MLQKELSKWLRDRYDTKMDGNEWMEVSSDGSGAVSNAESEFQYRHRLSLHGQRCRRSGGEQKDIRQTL